MLDYKTFTSLYFIFVMEFFLIRNTLHFHDYQPSKNGLGIDEFFYFGISMILHALRNMKT